jgi:heme/copper-type cytochrome/quinol oxidase subunit 4
MKPQTLFYAVLFFVLLIVLPVLTLYRISQSKFPENKQMKWMIIVLLIPIIGAFIYFIWGQKEKINEFFKS